MSDETMCSECGLRNIPPFQHIYTCQFCGKGKLVVRDETADFRRQLAERDERMAKLLAAALDFGGYAKVLMTDNHVTPEYLDGPGGYRDKFRRFEAAVEAAKEK